ERRGAQHAIGPKPRARGPEPRPLAFVEREPDADEFLDLDARADEPGEKEPQARHALYARREQPRIFELDEIMDAVAVLEPGRAEPDDRADIVAEAVLKRPVVLRDRPRIRPGAEEQREKAALEYVDEARKRVVARAQPRIGLVGRGQRKRALRA